MLLLRLLGCGFTVIEVAFVFRDRVVDLHRLWTFLLSDVGRARKFGVQSLLQGLNQLRLLLFNVCLVGVADEVDIFALLARLPRLLLWLPGLFLFETIKSRAVLLSLGCWLILRGDVANVLPIGTSEERVLLDLFNTV